MGKFKVVWSYFRTICKHKKWVFYYCKICGITWRGIKHDLSKFSPTEFKEYVKYYAGDKNPIDTCKEQNGYSLAWQHHKGRNDHHYEYWMDDFDKGGKAIKMPFDCAVELICDYLGAGHAYTFNRGEVFSYREEFDWFVNKINNGCSMHKDTLRFVYLVLRNLSSIDITKVKHDKKTLKYVLKEKYLDKGSLERLYDYASSLTDDKFNLIRKSTESREV